MQNFNKIIIHPNFRKTIDELSNNDIFLPKNAEEFNFKSLALQKDRGLLTNLEELKPYKQDIQNGWTQSKNISFSAYDESFLKYLALEGTAYFTTHSLIAVGKEEYAPVALATFYFYTRSKSILSKSSYIKYAEEPDIESKRDYLKDRINFLLEYTPRKTLLFIDGPLIGGDLYTLMIDANEKFLEKEIVPIFFVKNSTSNIVTENIESLRGLYNSDMHWLHNVLRLGERSCFFKYEDQVNKKNSKVFCYIKAFESGPQRVEMHTDTYLKYYIDAVPNIMDLILYLLCVQGSKTNPQLRPIAIAEAYARSILKSIDINRYFKEAKISPTLNQIRFGG